MSKEVPKILIAEDDEEIRDFLEMAFRCDGYVAELVDNGQEALEIFNERPEEFGAIVLNLLMPRKDGLTALREIRAADMQIPVIMISSAPTPQNITAAMKAGATDFLAKPLNAADLRKALAAARCTTVAPRKPPQNQEGRGRIFFGNSQQMRELRPLVRQIAASDAPVLIQGETGTGKEVLARELHANSGRAGSAFLKLNCAALPSELVESELFGYERGAFTGAFQRKAGMFELADRGTILLDEIGDMDFKLQSKLLQVLQDREFQRLGGKETVRVNVRVIAATHRDLESAISDETFREDLYYRLNVINIRLPALRERSDDILPLAELFVDKHATPATPAIGFTPALREAMLAHTWPGNIRELENVVRRFLVLRDADALASELRAKSARQQCTVLAAAATGGSVARPRDAQDGSSVLRELSKAKEHAETEAILSALASTRWNRKRAAQLLDIDYKALLYKMKKLSIGERTSEPL